MFLEIFDKPTKYLTFTGVWIDKSASRNCIFLALFVHLFFIEISMVFTIIHIFSVTNIIEFSAAMEMIPFFVGLFIKTINIVYNKKRIETLLKSLKTIIEENSWIEKQKGVKLRQRIRVIDKIFKYSICFISLSTVLKAINCIISKKLLIDLWLPYDYKSSSVLFWLTFVHEFIGGVIFVPVLIICDIFPNFFICFATGIIEELTERLCKIKAKPMVVIFTPSISHQYKSNNRNQQLKEEQVQHLKELTECIELHQKVKTLVLDIESIFGTILGTQGLFSVFILCTTLFSLTLVRLKLREMRTLINDFFLNSKRSQISQTLAIFSFTLCQHCYKYFCLATSEMSCR